MTLVGHRHGEWPRQMSRMIDALRSPTTSQGVDRPSRRAARAEHHSGSKASPIRKGPTGGREVDWEGVVLCPFTGVREWGLAGCCVDVIAVGMRSLCGQYQLKLASARLAGGVPGVLALLRARPTPRGAVSGPCLGQGLSRKDQRGNGYRPIPSRRRRVCSRSRT